MKKIICAAAAFACAGAFAQAPVAMPGPAKGSTDRVLLVSGNQMPLPPPPAELSKMQNISVLKAEDGVSTVDKWGEAVQGHICARPADWPLRENEDEFGG